jgi:hypothetical protein
VLVQTGRIYECDLRIRQVGNSNDAVAGCLGTRCNDAHLLTDHGVEESRFTHVGPADEGGKATAEFCGIGHLFGFNRLKNVFGGFLLRCLRPVGQSPARRR